MFGEMHACQWLYRGILRGVIVSCTVWASYSSGAEGASLAETYPRAGFDPAAKGAWTFVVIGDVHEPEYSQAFEQQLQAINQMVPRPRFVALLGDSVCSVSRNFGHIPDAKGLERAKAELESLRKKLAGLSPEIPAKLIIGNHDTYPGEHDAALFRSVFPSVASYESFEIEGVQFMIWNGGHDGAIDPRQRLWIAQTMTAFDPRRSVVVMVHQPALGQTVRERGIPAMVDRHLGAMTAPVWLLGGHEHINQMTSFALPKSVVHQAVHAKSISGYWIYGVRDGTIAARIWCDASAGYQVGQMPAKRDVLKPIPLPFASCDATWTLLIGDDAAQTQAAFVSGKGGNCGSWWFYVSELVYKLPLGEQKEKVKHFGVLANLSKQRKTGERPRIAASGDGQAWIETPVERVADTCHICTIPAALSASSFLYVRITSFGFGADTCVGGFALIR